MTIPTNLITGFLGVGKTTAVIDLLSRKPPGSRWAVLVNEYGEVAIDGALIEGSGPDGVTVREVGGGCVCCASAPYLGVALHFLLLDAKPEMRANPVFSDQVQLADVVVMNKLDAATPQLVADFRAWADGLFPPKLLVAGTTRGRLDPAWLDLTASDERLPLFPEAHEPGRTAPRERAEGFPPPGTHPAMGRLGPLTRGRSPEGGRPACGWVFSPDDVFDRDRLLALLGGPGVSRAKGVFRLAHEWVAVNRAGSELTVTPTAYRRDSRVEVFADDPDWDAFERELLACLLPAR